MDTQPATSTDIPTLLRNLGSLQAELECLKRRYDALLVAKNRAAARYKADYKKWRDFKRWLFEDLKRDNEIRNTSKYDGRSAYITAPTLGKRKQFEMIGLDVNDNIGGEVGRDARVLSGAKLCREDPPWEVNIREQAASDRCGNKDPLHSVVDGLVRAETSRGIDCGQEPKLEVSHTSKPEPEAETDLEVMLKPEPEPKPDCNPGHDAGIRPRRGRYAQAPPTGVATINSRFSIRTDHNQGMNFQFDAVVRDRDERRHMQGGDCECCRDYYNAVRPLPSVQGPPLWQSPTRKGCKFSPHLVLGGGKENADDVEQHKQRISRHRHHWHRSKTPPAYWEIGFPDTQEAFEINRRAAEMHKRKLIEVEAEARHPNGRYLEHNQRTP